MEFCEGVVATVEHVVRSGFIRDDRHGLRVVDGGGGDVVERRDVCLQVVENVGLHAALAPAEPCPGENREAQGNGRGIEGVHAAAQAEDLRRALPARLLHHGERELLEDAEVTSLVGQRDGVS